MREIVFRGKRVKPVTLVSQWIYGNYVFKADNSLPGLSKHFIVVHDGFGVSQWIEVEPDTVGQYTGLKDKSGQRIFEGDVVRVDLEKPMLACLIGEVYFTNGCYMIRPASSNLSLYAYHPYCTVIGNIHDNPELLEEENHHV